MGGAGTNPEEMIGAVLEAGVEAVGLVLEGCPISKLLTGGSAEITMDAKFIS